MNINRRAFLTTSFSLTAAALLQSAYGQTQIPPNLLIIVADQMCYPSWFPTEGVLQEYLPNLLRLRKDAISFSQHCG